MKLRITIYLVLLLLLINSISAGKSDLDYFDGVLKKIGEDWFLVTNGDFSQLDIAPDEYIESNDIVLIPKTELIIRGSSSDGIITVHTIYINDFTYEIRDDSGTPLWQEEDESSGYYIVNPKKCIGCQLCVSSCPTQAIKMIHGKAVIDADKCIDCGICEIGGNKYNGCPTDAIKRSK